MSEAKKMAKHSTIYAVGNISRQLVGFIMLPIYTRYLSPADYGVIGLLVFSVSLIELVFGARLVMAVPKFYFEQESEEKRNAVISTALIITSAVSALTMLVLISFRDLSSQGIFGTTDYGFIVGLFAVLVLTQALEYYALVFLRIRQRPWLFIGANLAKLALQLSLNIWLIVIEELGVTGVAIASITSSVIIATALSLYTLKLTGLGFDKPIAWRMFTFCWPLWIGGLAALYIGSSNRYFIRIFGSLEDVGLFELAAKFSAIIGLLIWQPFAQYWETERFNIYRRENPIPIYQAAFQLASAMLVIGGIGVALFARPTIEIMSADEFHGAYNAVPFLTCGVIFGCLTNYSNFSFLVKEKTGWISKNNYFTAVVVTVFYLVFIPEHGFVGAAAALALAQVVQFFIVQRAARKHYDMNLPTTALLIYVAVGVACVLTMSALAPSNIWSSIGLSAVISAMGASVITAHLIRNPMIKQQLTTVLKRKKPGEHA